MEIAAIGISHKEASVPIRSRVVFTTSMKIAATETLKKAGISEFLIISTCNRSEIYIVTKDMIKDINIVKNWFIKMADYEIAPYIFIKKYEVAIQHIYQVATGLNSMVIGEEEILGQMKSALDFAMKNGSSKKILTKVMREAITFSKKARHIYKMSKNQISVASIGITYLKEHYEDLSNKKILLIGLGAMGNIILKYLKKLNNSNIYVTNRTSSKEKNDDLVNKPDKSLHIVDYTKRYSVLEHMDIIISVTTSPHMIIKADKIKPLKKQTTFLDMAVPRDIDHMIDNMPLATVVTLDDFDLIVKKHLKLRQNIGNQINRLILKEVKELELWILSSKIDNIIKILHQKQERITNDCVNEIEELKLTKEQNKQIKTLIKKSTWDMIKGPINHLKTLKEEWIIDQYKMILEQLFTTEKGD